MRSLCKKLFGGLYDPCLLTRKNRLHGFSKTAAHLHFDETDHAAGRSRHQIDFSKVRAYAAAENAVAFGTQDQAREKFSPTTPTFRGLAPGKGNVLQGRGSFRANARA